jgi:hypothetical protein
VLQQLPLYVSLVVRAVHLLPSAELQSSENLQLLLYLLALQLMACRMVHPSTIPPGCPCTPEELAAAVLVSLALQAQGSADHLCTHTNLRKVNEESKEQRL